MLSIRGEPMEYYDVINDALNYIESNLNMALNLEDVADELGVSKYYFHRLFSATLGISFNQYLLSRKLNKSLKLMYETDLSLTDIAYEVNFGNQASFIRAFKQLYNQLPKDVRKNHNLQMTPVPEIVKRDIKNLNGDLVTDFTLDQFNTLKIKGIVFQVDLSKDYKKTIEDHMNLLLEHNPFPKDTKGYVAYSNCSPNSPKFNVIYGVPLEFETDLPNVYEAEIPDMFCAVFRYHGNIIKIGDVLQSDFSRFLKISKNQSDAIHIDFFQEFDQVGQIEK